MRRGEIWWAHFPDGAKRPVLLLSRDEAYLVRKMVTVAPVTTRIRGIRVEVPLGPEHGLPQACVVNLDRVTTLSKDLLAERIGKLAADRMDAVGAALRFALALDD